MSNPLILNTPQVLAGLGTMTFTLPTTGLYNVQVQSTEVPPSGISIVVNQNGSPIYTAPTLSPTQSAIQFKTGIEGTAADAITVVLSSASAIDSAFNNVKSTISIGTDL